MIPAVIVHEDNWLVLTYSSYNLKLTRRSHSMLEDGLATKNRDVTALNLYDKNAGSSI